MEAIINRVESRMQKALEVLRRELLTIRTGKAAPSLVEGVEINVYDGHYKLIELAQITAPEVHQLLIQPYDPGIAGDIKKGIEAAGLGLNPILDGEILRIAIPPLTEERRAELAKAVHQRLEGARIMIRQIRQEFMDEIEKDYKGKRITEDDRFRLRDEIQKVVDEKNDQIEQMGKTKEKELMQV
jgi:ribosome recycling factor